MKHIYLILAALFVFSCGNRQSKSVSFEQIETEEAAGNFTQASYLINLYIAENKPAADTVYKLNWRKDKMQRIMLDFSKDKESVVEYVKKYIPEVDDEMLLHWEADKSLEYMIIDGKKKYFNRGASNLFRLNKEAATRKQEVDKPATDAKEETLRVHLPEIISTLSKNGKTQASPVGMTVKYKITLKPNVVPDGEMVRCWLPFPREDERRQTAVKLISVNDDNYIISPDKYAHRTIYMEKIAKKDEALNFEIEFSYKSAPEWFNLNTKNTKPYQTDSDIYRKYTSERPPHLLFSDSIKAISHRIIGDETNPYQKVKKIFTWIDKNFPWAGAREYSTIDNIPEYVLANSHGDCGQVTLLFITLARYNGIPARWQGGFMMHPDEVNLHDWGEYYIEEIGWIPIDQSFGINKFSNNEQIGFFYSNGIDAYRWIVNNDYSQPLFPAKIYPRSETVDFQRGELEWKGGNLYFDKWNWDIDVTYMKHTP